MAATIDSQCAASGEELAPAGYLSRIGKLIAGLLQVQLAFTLMTNPGLTSAESPWSNPTLWFVIVLAFALFSWTVNLGFNRSWGKKPFFAAVATVLATLGLGVATGGSAWGLPIAAVLYAVTLYVHGHMGISHVLAALVGTPGCEMRVIPQLWARFTGGAAELKVCPGFWTPLDNWERALRQGRKQKAEITNH